MQRNMEVVIFLLLFIPSIGIPGVQSYYGFQGCINGTIDLRCDDGLVISVQDGIKGTSKHPKGYCGESLLKGNKAFSSDSCILDYLQSTCDNKSSCYLGEEREHSCSTSERRRIVITYRCISRCGLNDTCNETTEYCVDSEDGAECICAENYHKNENNICIHDLSIRCESGVINMTKSRSRRRSTFEAYRGRERIPNYRAHCSTEEEFNNTQARCNNKQFCKIPERNSNGPCFFFMVYDCVPKCGYNDGCDMTTQACINTENGIRCDCAENYKENGDGYCTAMNTTHSGSHQFANESIFIYCDNGTINIERATQGERPTFTVIEGGKVMPNYSAPCLSHEVLASLETVCDNKSRCKISDAIGEDSPCQSYMSYTCEMITTHKEISSQCANMSINIHCDNSIIKIIEETQKFGKPTFIVNCGERVIKNYSVPCLSRHDFTRIRAECDTKASCNISYETNEDSPCHSYLNYSCVSGCGITDNCNNTSEVCIDSKNGTKCNCAEGYERNNDGACTEIVPKCPFVVQNVKGVIMAFNETLSGEVAFSNQLCPPESAFPNISLATRKCTGTTWNELESTECYTADTLNDQLEVISQMDVTDDNVKEVADTLAIASGQPEHITEDGLESLITSLDSVVQVGNPSPQVTDSVVGVVSNVMAINGSTLSDTQNVNSIVSVLENQVASLLKVGQNYSELTDNVEVNALQIERDSLRNNYTFLSHLGKDTSDNDDVEDEWKTSSILLPSSILDLINKDIETVPISLIAYEDDSLFQTRDVKSSEDSMWFSSVIGSHVISATVEIKDVTVKDLSPEESVLTRFSLPVIPPQWNDTNTTFNFVCVYWDTKKATWSQDGCRSLSNESDNEILCSCDHLTSFAVLVRAHKPETIFDQVLAIATKVGCIICIISLSSCVLALLLVRPVRKKQQTHVHLNLCLALLGFYFSFLLGIDKEENPKLCKAMTSLIYFFCLSSMAWMSVEAFYIYTLIWKYKRSGIKHFIPVAAFFAWGLPAFGSGLIFVLEEPHDYVNEPDYCFLHPGYVFKYGFILEMGILFLYNIIVFTLVTYRVSCRRIYFSKKDEKKIEIMTRVKSTFLFWILLGISWIFGFVPVFQRSPNHFCEAMFCLCMSLQGFCMLYMLILQNPEMMKTLRGKRKPLFSSVTMASGMKNVYVLRRNSGKGSTLRMQSNPLSSTTEYF